MSRVTRCSMLALGLVLVWLQPAMAYDGPAMSLYAETGGGVYNPQAILDANPTSWGIVKNQSGGEWRFADGIARTMTGLVMVQPSDCGGNTLYGVPPGYRELIGPAGQVLRTLTGRWAEEFPETQVLGIRIVNPTTQGLCLSDMAVTLVELRAPGAPHGLGVTTGKSVMLSWSDPTTGGAPAGYRVYRDGAPLVDQVGRTYDDLDVEPGMTYQYAVVAYNAAGESTAATVSVMIPEPDRQPPGSPRGLEYEPLTNGIRLTWTANGDEDLAGYRVYVDGHLRGETNSTEYLLTVEEYRAYQIALTAVDQTGNESSPVTTIGYPVDPSTPPLEPPQAPTNTRASVGSTQVTLTWSAPAGGGLVESYRVLRDGELVGTSASRSFTDRGLEPRRTYTYAVTAVNSAGESPVAQIRVTMAAPGVIDGVTTSLSGLGQRLQEGIRIFLPFFLLSAGIVVARIVLRTGLTWFQAQRRGS